MIDLHGQALYDYYCKLPVGKLWIHNNYGKKEEMPIPVYFRKEAEMPALELFALQQCKGKILDIGAGAGSHALILQQKGFAVTALEISPKAAEVMRLRGVEKVTVTDILTCQDEQYDTLLLLMNGIGLTGTVEGLKRFLNHAKKLVPASGQLLFDSSDVAYLYDGNIPEMNHYYGEIAYRYEYKKQKTGWFNWLYVDSKTLAAIADDEGWQTKILFEDDYDQYLAQLVLK